MLMNPDRQCEGKTILSLFDYTGNWARPYAEAGADVICIDRKHGHDVGAFTAEWLYEEILDNSYSGMVDAILAAPPCTDFAVSGARWWPAKDADGRTQLSVHLVEQVLRTVEFLQPDFWVLENPVGRIETLVPDLKGYGPYWFQPCDFGDPYTKKTGLWGEFVPPLPLFIGGARNVEPTEGSKMWRNYGGKSERTKTARSATPMGFAQAFFDANCWLEVA